MTKPVKIINALAKDEMGWDYPQAVIAFYHIGKHNVELLTANDGDSAYKISQEIESISYTVNFWGNAGIRQRGCKSRPMFVLDADGELQYDDDDNPVRSFEVDMSKPQYQQLMNATPDALENVFKIIERHYREEVIR